MSSCLITGGAGAIGSNLAALLLGRGHKVTVIDDLSSGHRILVPAGARFIEGSIESDDKLSEAFAGKPKWVFHLAALFANQNSVDHPERDLLVNGRGTIKLLEHAVASGVSKVLFTSSSCVYGHKEVMHEDDIDVDLDTPYAITKLLGEQYCKYWARAHGLNTVIVRLFNAYGPHEYPGPYRNVVPNFFRLAMRGEPLPITGTGEETRDFNFVGDVAEGLLAAVEADTPTGEIYNIASGTGTRILELAETINRLTSNTAGIVFKERRGWDRVLNRRGDASKASAAFGYQARTPLAEGLARTYAWLKSIDA